MELEDELCKFVLALCVAVLRKAVFDKSVSVRMKISQYRWIGARFLCWSDRPLLFHGACDAARLVSSRFVLHVASMTFLSTFC